MISLEWIFEGDRIQDHVVQTLLDKAIDTFGSKDLSDPIDWAHTFIQVPGYAGFDIEPENGANYGMSWRDAVSVVHGVKDMMAREGSYERGATILLAGRIPIARLAIFLEGLEEKTKDIKDVTGSADLLASTTTTNGSTSPRPEPHDRSISLRPTKRGEAIENFGVVKDMLSDAISVALAHVADGQGEQITTWRDLRWREHGIAMTIWPKRGVTHGMNWQRALQVLLLTQKLVQSPFGYTEFDAEIVWKVAQMEEDIGNVQLCLIDRTTIVPSDTPITAALGNLTTLGNREGIIYLRYTSRGGYISALSVLGVFRGALGAALDELDEGKENEPVGWKELKYFGPDILLVVKAFHEVHHRLTWGMLVRAEEMMSKHLTRTGYRELGASIMWKDQAPLDDAEVIGSIKLAADNVLKSDAAPTIATA